MDSFNADLDTWLEGKAEPKLRAIFTSLFEAYWLKLEHERGALLETCEEGNACRLQLEQDMKSKIQTYYLDLLA